ncbi:GspE/PulE family protein [Thioalkalivibrio sp. HK1]|uniref:GspE/PulE family protein n=1 Tax=Thioalkalivibrio sp. HK1 TaxID=1469245 RepID=UPI0004B8A399|nr:GspE/PulE family protein [Thioalkalivibrio sp. HK1]
MTSRSKGLEAGLGSRLYGGSSCDRSAQGSSAQGSSAQGSSAQGSSEPPDAPSIESMLVDEREGISPLSGAAASISSATASSRWRQKEVGEKERGSPDLSIACVESLLIESGAVSEDQIAIALTEQRQRGGSLEDNLIRLGFVSGAILRDILGGALGIESVDLARTIPDARAIEAIPVQVARRFLVVGLTLEEKKTPTILRVAMVDPFDVIALDHIRSLIGEGVRILSVLASRADIEEFIDRYCDHDLSITGILDELEQESSAEAIAEAEGVEYTRPIVRLVDGLLFDAVRQEASDVHFEPEAGFLRVRYRIDGVLRQVRSLHREYWPAIAVRLKVMSGMNIAETRAPQDGRMTLSVGGREIDCRVSSLPVTYGENIVLRVLDRSRGILSLDALDMSAESLAEIHRMMERPSGVILVTGPTGSGKTTTLYSMLVHLDREGVNIMTLEDPVEYPMSRIRQTSINESIKFGFADGVRSLMRQDPDIILVGEIRDSDTATMAFRAAMTGHQVYSTLHSSSAIAAIPRLLDIGVSTGAVAGNIIGIVAQRLVRRLCRACRMPADGPDPSSPAFTLDGSFAASTDFPARAQAYSTANAFRYASPEYSGAGCRRRRNYRAVGCDECDHQGFRGRMALTEVLRFDDEIGDLVARGATPRELQEAAMRKGFVSLAEDAKRRIADGSSTVEEVSRMVDPGSGGSFLDDPIHDGSKGVPGSTMHSLRRDRCR